MVWRYVRLPSDRALDRSVAAVQEAIRGFIAGARHRMQLDPSLREQPRNLLEAMSCAADRADSDVNDHDVAGNVIVLLLAGEDTTANTLAWMIELLHRHPEALERARAEVRSLAPDPAGFTPEQMAALDYLDACAQETMRLKRVSMPFGAGPRICPGRYLALLEMNMAMLLSSFGIETVAPAEGGTTREHLFFSMGPVGLRMRLRPLHGEFQRLSANGA
uniref:Cytochrome P450 n=1 Tax=mine drainage metagenome TaxID=410659 RepID=E6PR03_9ZZZZ